MEDGSKRIETQLLQLRLQFMREWTAVFFPEMHRSVINILCGLRLKGIDRFDKNTPGHCFREIKDIDDLLTELKNGKLVTIEEVRASKGEKKTQFIAVDFNFFNVFPTLYNVILEEIKPKLEDFKKFRAGEIKKVCKNCGVEKTESELSFLGMKCNCTNTNFQSVEPNKREIQRLEFLKNVLEKRFMTKKRTIEELQKRLSEANLKRKKKQEDKKTNQFDDLCTKYNLPKGKEEFIIKLPNWERMRSDKLCGRRDNFVFLEELNKIREHRKSKYTKESCFGQQNAKESFQ